MPLIALWSMYYSGVVSFQYHPGNKEKLSLEQCADIADEMLAQALKREALWVG